jgi:long-chain acyl-CoA synthetase
MTPEEMLGHEFGSIPALIHLHAKRGPDHPALIQGERQLEYGALDNLMDRIAASMQHDGLQPEDAIAICAGSSIEYAATFLGALRSGIAVAPLAPSSTAESLLTMIADSGAKLFFLDAAVAETMKAVNLPSAVKRVSLDGSNAGVSFHSWLVGEEAKPKIVQIQPTAAFNIIYSSGTTGTPKGIVQSNRMRWSHVNRGLLYGYGPDATAMISTPLYSNTTLVSFFPTIACGGTVVLMEKFDPVKFLALAEKHRATHSMLVPVQYRRLLEHPDFDRFDLSNYRMKFCTSAPFAAALKADILKRWPGGLVEFYGLTEGGGTCMLVAHEFPDKLHTVGKPAPEHDIRLIDESGKEVAAGEIGEVVGHSPAIMNGYHNQPQKTAEAEWYDASGKRFIRTGDVGRFDTDGFLTLMDRKKDMIISGGFNVYPSDLEAILIKHEAVAEVAVVGVPSDRWGETPVAFVVLLPGSKTTPDQLREWVNSQVGKVQRIADVRLESSLPRSAIGKVLKRELRERYKPTINV